MKVSIGFINVDECEKRPIFNSQDEKSIYRGGNQSYNLIIMKSWTPIIS